MRIPLVARLFRRGFLRQRVANRNTRMLTKNLRGVFHSFKNTLFTIRILAEQAAREGDADKETVERIRMVAETALSNVTRLMDTVKDVQVDIERSSLAVPVEEALKRLVVPRSISLARRSVGSDFECLHDSFHVTEAIFNVLQNALEAVEASGREDGRIEVALDADAEWIRIEVRDNGVGIKRGEERRVFDPLYTTKPRHKNWGVGLTYVRRVMDAHFGRIEIESSEGQGTAVWLSFPKD